MTTTAETTELKTEIAELKTETTELKTKTAELKKEIAELKTEPEPEPELDFDPCCCTTISVITFIIFAILPLINTIALYTTGNSILCNDNYEHIFSPYEHKDITINNIYCSTIIEGFGFIGNISYINDRGYTVKYDKITQSETSYYIEGQLEIKIAVYNSVNNETILHEKDDDFSSTYPLYYKPIQIKLYSIVILISTLLSIIIIICIIKYLK